VKEATLMVRFELLIGSVSVGKVALVVLGVVLAIGGFVGQIWWQERKKLAAADADDSDPSAQN
jgi:hypothetical protein